MNPNRFRSSAWLLLALASLGAASRAQSPDFRDLLPAETLAFVRLPDLLTSQREFLDAPLARMAREPDLRKFLAPLLADGEREWDRLLQRADAMHEAGALPLSAAELQELRVHSAGLALTRVDLDVREPHLNVGLLLHLDFGQSAPLWRKLIDFGLAALQQRSGSERTTKQVAGTDVWTFAGPWNERRGTDMVLAVACTDTGVLVGTLANDVERALARLATGGRAEARAGARHGDVTNGKAHDGSASDGDAGEARFTATATYRTVAQHLQLEGCEVEAFVRVAGMLDLLVHGVRDMAGGGELPIDADGLERALAAIGLRGIESVGLTSTYRGPQTVTKTFVHAPAPERAGLLAGGAKPLDLSFLKWVPKDAVSLSAWTFDVAGVHDAVFGALRAYDERLADAVQARLDAFAERSGVSLKEDLIGALGNQIVSWSMPMSGNATGNPASFLSGTWLVQVRDQERLVKALKALAQLTDGMVELGESERRGVKSWWVQLHLDGAAQMPIDFSKLLVPNFTFQNGYMVVGLQKADLRKALARLQRTEDDGNDLRANPEFAKCLEQLPKDKLTSLSFTDWKTQFAGWYDLAYNFSFLFGTALPIDPAELPQDPIFLNQHLSGSVSWSTSDGMGLESTSISPWGLEVPAVLGAAAAALGIGVASDLGPRRADVPVRGFVQPTSQPAEQEPSQRGAAPSGGAEPPRTGGSQRRAGKEPARRGDGSEPRPAGGDLPTGK